MEKMGKREMDVNTYCCFCVMTFLRLIGSAEKAANICVTTHVNTLTKYLIHHIEK